MKLPIDDAVRALPLRAQFVDALRRRAMYYNPTPGMEGIISRDEAQLRGTFKMLLEAFDEVVSVEDARAHLCQAVTLADAQAEELAERTSQVRGLEAKVKELRALNRQAADLLEHHIKVEDEIRALLESVRGQIAQVLEHGAVKDATNT